ncbi:hypothetical protein U9M48_042149, partial [Paspalum notatum var. saurae]
AYMDARRNPEILVNKGWKKSADIVSSGHTRALCLPDASTSSSKVMCLLYTNEGDRLLALSSNAVHKLWKWEHGDEGNPRGKASTSVPPQLWQPEAGIVMINDTANGNPEAAAACTAVLSMFDLSKLKSVVCLLHCLTQQYSLVVSWPGRLALFDLIHQFCGIAHRMKCYLYLLQPSSHSTRKTISWLLEWMTRQLKFVMSLVKKITELAFSKSENVLVSSDFDAQLCVWRMEDWEKTYSTYIQPPCNCSGALVGDTTVQYHYDETHILVVHETQLAIYDVKLECPCSWTPRDALPAPISSTIYSSDGLLVCSGFCAGAIGIFEAESLTLQCRIARYAYIPSSVSRCVWSPKIYILVLSTITLIQMVTTNLFLLLDYCCILPSGGGNVYPMAVAANPWKP